MKLKNRQSDIGSTIKLIVFVAIILITFFVAVPVFAMVFTQVIEPSQLSVYHDSVNCTTNGGNWADSKCVTVDSTAYKTIKSFRKAWLITPIILIIGLIFWYFSKIFNKDTFDFDSGGRL